MTTLTSTTHVLPAMIRKFHEAKIKILILFILWDLVSPLREFLNILIDFADTMLANNKKLSENLYNIGYGSDISILDLSLLVKEIVSFKGKILWDKSKPDGTPKKLMDGNN